MNISARYVTFAIGLSRSRKEHLKWNITETLLSNGDFMLHGKTKQMYDVQDPSNVR